jgi:hypothetical protein
MRVLIIQGEMTRNMSAPTPPPQPSPSPAPNPPQPPSPPVPTPSRPTDSRWLVQFQPAFGLTPPVFVTTAPPSPVAPTTIVSAQVLMGLVFRTATHGPHWEFGIGGQPQVNSVGSLTDPRYTLAAQGSVAFADPFSAGAFHTQIFDQTLLIRNFVPGSSFLGNQFGIQLSVDIIEDKWNFFFGCPGWHVGVTR